MTFIRPTLSDLIERNRADIEARLPGADTRLRRSVLDVLARMHSGAMASAYGYLDWAARQIFPDTAESEQLGRWAAIWGVQRKAAIAATGDAAVTGVNGSAIPADSVLVRSDGARYLVTSAAVIAAGTATIAISAEDAGVDGSMAAGQSLVFASPIVGVSAEAVIGADGISGGAAEEDDEALRARLLERIRKPPEGGNSSDYRGWLLAVPEVTRAWVYPGWMGPGTVGLTFVCDGREDIIPDADIIEIVEAHIGALRPVTATIHVFAPTPRSYDMVIRAVPGTSAVQDAIMAEIADLLFREAEPGGTILISHAREAISVAAGEYDHELASPMGNVTADPGELFVPGEIEWLP